MSTTVKDVPRIAIGQINTVGRLGPKYQIRKLLSPVDQDDWLVEILLIESGEVTEYPYSRIINDPEADQLFAIAFDLVVKDAERHHPKGAAQAYADIGKILGARGFERVQGSLYVTNNEDMANLFVVMMDLRSQPWFPPSVRDIRAFRIEQWSDFTPVVKSPI